MQVNSTNHMAPMPENFRRTSPAEQPQQSQVDFATTNAINKAVAESPSVRPEAVAKAKSLIEDTKYPPDETIRRIAHLMAIEFRTESD